VNRRPPYVRLYTSSCAKAKYENAAKTPTTPNAHSSARLRSARDSFAVDIVIAIVVSRGVGGVVVSRVEPLNTHWKWKTRCHGNRQLTKTTVHKPEMAKKVNPNADWTSPGCVPSHSLKGYEPSIRLKSIRVAARRRQPGAPHKTSTDERSNDWTTSRRRSKDARGFVSARFDDARPVTARIRRVDDCDDAFVKEIFL
jgi:hypothetical protein